MEGSRASVGEPVRSDASAIRLTQIGLLVASLGAVLVVFHFFGLGVVGLFLGVGGAALAAPGGIGKRWFWAVAIGAIVMVLSRLIAESAETMGGWLAVFGALSVLVGTSLGFPTKGDSGSRRGF
jgi:hypothetical protein